MSNPRTTQAQLHRKAKRVLQGTLPEHFRILEAPWGTRDAGLPLLESHNAPPPPPTAQMFPTEQPLVLTQPQHQASLCEPRSSGTHRRGGGLQTRNLRAECSACPWKRAAKHQGNAPPHLPPTRVLEQLRPSPPARQPNPCFSPRNSLRVQSLCRLPPPRHLLPFKGLGEGREEKPQPKWKQMSLGATECKRLR